MTAVNIKARDILIVVTLRSEQVRIRSDRVYILYTSNTTYSLKLRVVDMARGEFHTEKRNVDTGTLNLYTGG